MEEESSAGSEPMLTDLSSEALLSMGDSYYVDENYEDAVEAYAAALAVFRDSEVVLQIRCLSHRSATFYKLQRYQDALEDADLSLVLLSMRKPSGLRTGEGETCHYRAGLAAFELLNFKKAMDSFNKAAQLASLNKRYGKKATYENWLEKCNSELTSPEQTSAVAKSSSSDSKQSSLEKDHVVPPKPVVAAPPALAGNKGDVPKYQYYQSDKVMTISILEAGVREEDLTVQFEPKHLIVMLRKIGTEFTVIAGNLYAEIDVEKSKVVIKDEKVLVKLRKVDNKYEWHELMGKGDDSTTSTKVRRKDTSEGNSTDDATSLPKKIPTIPKDSAKPRPYASHRDWDKIEKDIIEDEKNEKPEGDEAMNKLFKQIYGDASDDTRRAMVKSFQTSGGTVLSTNWDEVKEKDYEKERTGKKSA